MQTFQYFQEILSYLNVMRRKTDLVELRFKTKFRSLDIQIRSENTKVYPHQSELTNSRRFGVRYRFLQVQN